MLISGKNRPVASRPSLTKARSKMIGTYKVFIAKPWGGMSESEYAELRYSARKHLDARLAKRKGNK